MLHLYTGTDRAKVRAALAQALGTKVTEAIQITDAHTIDDLRAVLAGGGMFGGARTVVLDGVFANKEMRDVVGQDAAALRVAADTVYILEESIDAATRKTLEKHTETSVRHDMPAKGKDNSIFAIANALRAHDKKTLWVAYQRELIGGAAPEAIHGVLFWAVKDMLGKARDAHAQSRARRLIALLADLPHVARRRGEDVSYALERFVLSDAVI